MKGHLEVCSTCRLSFSDLGTIHSACFPQIAGFEVERPPHVEGRLRNSILRTASREGAHFSEHIEPRIEYEKPQRSAVGTIRGIKVWAVGASLLAISGCVWLGLFMRQSGKSEISVPIAVPGTVVPSVSAELLGASRIEGRRRRGEMLEQEVAALKAERTRMEHALERAQSDNKSLQTTTAEMNEQIVSLTTDLQTTHSQQVKAENALQQLKSEREGDQSAIQAQNREIRSLNEKLQQQTSLKEHDQDVLDAETRLRELVGARNLHIVDVYDTDANGKTRKAVGRVFYTEGQSLAFYAYDLSTKRFESGKYAYYVWGRKEGHDESVRNLGTLNPDDISQKRWMLKVNDAKALSNIDRVFVTLEQSNKLDLRPHGKELLNAFLGSPPNHP